MLQRTGNPIPSGLSNLDGFIHSIHDPGSPVKLRINSQTETRQFKLWFKGSKVVNQDGTPKVMYHGTSAENGEFYVFDYSKAVKRGGLGLRALGKGNYFTAKKLDGTERYGSRVIEAYLQIKTPFVYEVGSGLGEQVAKKLGVNTDGMNGDRMQQLMRDHGYDGVIQYDADGEVSLAVTFGSNQIKSATDNIGTFDKNNPDIRYSVDDAADEDVEGLSLPTLEDLDGGEPTGQKENTARGGAENIMSAKMNFTSEEKAAIQGIGRKSINQLSNEDIKATEKLARRYWKEMGTKSPFFRVWFGDWRINDQTPIQIADQPGDTRGVQRNADTGWDIQVSGQVFAESKHFANKNKSAIPYLRYVNDIVEKAILLDSYGIEKGKAKSENSLLMHSLYAVADIGYGPELLKLYIEEMHNPNTSGTAKRAYQLQNIEKASVVNGGVQGNTLSSLANTTNAIRTVADLFAAVKAKDANFNPKPASKVVNEDGTPMIVYHGTSDDFTVFKHSELSDREGSFFFAQNREDAEAYSGNGKVMEAYVNLQNPIDYNDMPSEIYKLRSKREQVDALRKLGYDGWMCDMETGWGEISAFNAEQIKSATDNIGTFDGNNPDIRYSVDDAADEDVEGLSLPTLENVGGGKRNDSAYLDAVQRGDMETAQQMVESVAKAAGYTIKAYHGTTNRQEKNTWNQNTRSWDTEYSRITVFKRQYPEQAGYFFNSDIDNAGGYGSDLYSVYLMLKKPLIIDCKGQNYASISFDGKVMDTYEWAEFAKKARYDGVIFENISDGVSYDDLSRLTTDYVVFDANRIKSADAVTYDNAGNIIPLSERFSVVNRDIRYSVDDTTDEDIEGLSLPNLDDVEEESVDDHLDNSSPNGVEYSSKAKKGESAGYDQRGVQRSTQQASGSADKAAGVSAVGRRDRMVGRAGAKNKAWRDLSRRSRDLFRREVENTINQSPNYEEIRQFLAATIGKPVQDMSLADKTAAIETVAERIYADLLAYESAALAENNWNIIGNITPIIEAFDRVQSKKANKDRYSVDDSGEDDIPGLSLPGLENEGAEEPDYAALENQYTAEQKDHRTEWFKEKLGEEGYQKYRAYEKEKVAAKKQQSREKQQQKNREERARIAARTEENVQKLTDREAREQKKIKPTKAKKKLKETVLDLFSIPVGQRAELGSIIDGYAERLIKNGSITEADRKAFFDRMYDAGVMTVPAEEYWSDARSYIAKGRIYVNQRVKAELGDDWLDLRRRAFAAKVYLVNDPSAPGIDQWNATLAEPDMLPGLFDAEDTDLREILERIIQVAEEGRDEQMSLAEYTAMLAQQEYVSEAEVLDNMERQLDQALRTFTESASIEISVKEENVTGQGTVLCLSVCLHCFADTRSGQGTGNPSPTPTRQHLQCRGGILSLPCAVCQKTCFLTDCRGQRSAKDKHLALVGVWGYGRGRDAQ